MPLSRRDIERALVNKLGFRPLEGDHRVFVFEVAGKAVAKTKTSRGTKHRTIGDELIAEMAKQLFITRKFFAELVRCTKTKSDYLRVLADRGVISPDAAAE